MDEFSPDDFEVTAVLAPDTVEAPGDFVVDEELPFNCADPELVEDFALDVVVCVADEVVVVVAVVDVVVVVVDVVVV